MPYKWKFLFLGHSTQNSDINFLRIISRLGFIYSCSLQQSSSHLIHLSVMLLLIRKPREPLVYIAPACLQLILYVSNNLSKYSLNMLAGVITMIVQTIFESSFYDEKLPRDTQYRKLRESAKDKKKSIFK